MEPYFSNINGHGVYGLYARPDAINLERAQALLKRSSTEIGPNCFNSVLYLKGAVDSLHYTSDSEFSVYLENSCRALPSGSAVIAGDVLVYRTSSRLLVHASVALNSTQALEKDSLYGSSSVAQAGDPRPGFYLTRSFSQSLYSSPQADGIFGEKFQSAIYRCDKDPAKSSSPKKSLQKELTQQQTLRKAIQEALVVPGGPLRDLKIKTVIVPILKSIKGTSSDKTLQGLIHSNTYQIYLLACGKSLEEFGECYNPEMEAVFEEIERFL